MGYTDSMLRPKDLDMRWRFIHMSQMWWDCLSRQLSYIVFFHRV